MEALARILVERFRPEHLDPAYRAEVERSGVRLPDPVDQSCMVTFVDVDRERSIRALTFGEVAEAVLGAGFRPVATAVEDSADDMRAGARAVEALARILDPEAFDPPVEPRDVGLELYRHDRRRVAVLSATRAVAAGYRLAGVDDRSGEIQALERALKAAREHARVARTEGLDQETCRYWSATCGWLRSRIRKLTDGIEPDWPDAARFGPVEEADRG